VRRVLFVDDEPQLLDGLRDALRPWRRHWQMTFAPDGLAALGALQLEAYDAVVTDMRMPGMDGAALLGEVQRIQPTAVRIVLSGYAEGEAVARAANVAHRFLSKPCEVDELVRVVQRSCGVNALVEHEDLRRAAAGTGRLPSVPRLYSELTVLMNDPDATLADVEQLVTQDAAMAAKVLQLANSAYFGRARSVDAVGQAIGFLGLNSLKALVLSAGAMAAFQPARRIDGFSIERVQRHSALVARTTRALLDDREHAEGAVAAALIHEVGLLVLASRAPDYLAEALARAEEEERPLYEVERELRGFTHAEIGAHVLGLWGLPHGIVEAVAYHHDPAAAHDPQLDAVTAVHVANVLADEHDAAIDPARRRPAPPLDIEHLERVGVSDRVGAWRAAAELESQR
jgi:HD-like signal output (HDOD) protein/ActR/RegA family two-component response regulator